MSFGDSQWNPSLLQLPQAGAISSHLTLRERHVRQPVRDFLCPTLAMRVGELRRRRLTRPLVSSMMHRVNQIRMRQRTEELLVGTGLKRVIQRRQRETLFIGLGSIAFSGLSAAADRGKWRSLRPKPAIG